MHFMTKKELREWAKQHRPKFHVGDKVTKMAFVTHDGKTVNEIVEGLTVQDVKLHGNVWPFWLITAIGPNGSAWWQASELFFLPEIAS